MKTQTFKPIIMSFISFLPVFATHILNFVIFFIKPKAFTLLQIIDMYYTSKHNTTAYGSNFSLIIVIKNVPKPCFRGGGWNFLFTFFFIYTLSSCKAWPQDL